MTLLPMTPSPPAGQMVKEPLLLDRDAEREVGPGFNLGSDFEWERLVAVSLHPLKVAIVEALSWVQRPLSATELARMVGGGKYSRDLIQYHAGCLENWGVLAVAEVRRTQGGWESYYFFSDGSEPAVV
jgi:hypothetical protein